MREFFLNWQDPFDRRWLAVGKLMQIDELFLFAYTKGALTSEQFTPFGNMTDMHSVYVSNELFPIFANRVLSERRPEYSRYLEWSRISNDRLVDPLLLMSRMGGARATDTLQVYPVPSPIDGNYVTAFFSHGVSHLPLHAQQELLSLATNDRLFPLRDIQNPFDPNAVCLRTSDPAFLVGYCPRYLAGDISKLAILALDSLIISVERVNMEAPNPFKLLCKATCEWPDGFRPCDDDEHRTVSEFDPTDMAEHVRRHHTTVVAAG